VPADWVFRLAVPDGWIGVDLGRLPVDRRSDLVLAVDQLVADAPGLRGDTARLVAVAEGVVADAEAHDALLAAVGFEVVGGALVALSLAAYGVPGDEAFDVDALAEDLDGGEVVVVDLPVGRAVRVHAVSEAAPGPDGRALVIEGVDHFIPVPGRTDMLLLTGSTPSLAAGDAPPPIFDEIAASVRFATAAEGDDGGDGGPEPG
jgi:hypothetical protein